MRVALAAAWMIAAAVAVASAACSRGAVAPVAEARDGMSIALYTRQGGGYAVVDDRRWVDVAGDRLVLDRVDPGAALPSLVIEPLAGGALEVGACTRDRGAPALRCAVRAAPGRYLVRVLYVSAMLGYRPQHDIAITAPGRARVASRYAITTPAWHARAEVTLFDGAPGGGPAAAPPREIARGAIALDGGAALLAAPPRTVDAQLRRIYDGAVHRPDVLDPRDPRWGRESQAAVWVCLELGGLGDSLAPGPIRVRVALPGEPARDTDVPTDDRRRRGGELRLPLWIDESLRGRRDRSTQAPDDGLLSDRFQIAITNSGDAAREVWIEESLRHPARPTVVRAWPRSPELGRQRLRLAITVGPGAVERAGFTIEYEK